MSLVSLTSVLKYRRRAMERSESSLVGAVCSWGEDANLGFRVETAVKQILCGLKVKTGASVSNAQCLDWYKVWAEKH